MRLMFVVAVGQCDYGRHAGIRTPNDSLAICRGVKAESGVLLVQTMIVAARQKRTHEKSHTLGLTEQTPADLRDLRFTRHENLLLHTRAILEFENPARPRLSGELLD